MVLCDMKLHEKGNVDQMNETYEGSAASCGTEDDAKTGGGSSGDTDFELSLPEESDDDNASGGAEVLRSAPVDGADEADDESLLDSQDTPSVESDDSVGRPRRDTMEVTGIGELPVADDGDAPRRHPTSAEVPFMPLSVSDLPAVDPATVARPNTIEMIGVGDLRDSVGPGVGTDAPDILRGEAGKAFVHAMVGKKGVHVGGVDLFTIAMSLVPGENGKLKGVPFTVQRKEDSCPKGTRIYIILREFKYLRPGTCDWVELHGVIGRVLSSEPPHLKIVDIVGGGVPIEIAFYLTKSQTGILKINDDWCSKRKED